MLALAPSDDAEMLTFIITNHGKYPEPPSRVTVTLGADATLQSLHEKVAEETQLVPGTFELRKGADGPVYRLDSARADVATIAEAGLQNKCRMLLHGVNGNLPVPSGGLTAATAAAALGQVALWSSARGEQSGTYGPINRAGSSAAAEPNADGYVGLVNQGATCYLSSLLQSLYMTPEFRRLMYEADSGADAAGGGGGILSQLQRLFVGLQTSDAQAINTRSLTQSFGWDASDSFTQHDVQELLRVLFDALEAELEATSQKGALQRIYRGEWSDFVQCKACRQQSSNPQSFDDINLAIRAFDAQQTPFVSLEAALAAFLEPETLDGDNAYFCEACNCKRPALKGTRLLSLPPVLCIGLKRFDFDFATLSRVKLHHPVRIPRVLEADPYLGRRVQPRTGGDADEADAGSSPSASASASASTSGGGGGGGVQYELFSLLMHSGSATAGHYFAYIKELASGKWYKFNDSHVTAATDAQLEDAMKGMGSGHPSTYMCLFRRKGGSDDDACGLHVPVPAGLREQLEASVQTLAAASDSSAELSTASTAGTTQATAPSDASQAGACAFAGAASMSAAGAAGAATHEGRVHGGGSCPTIHEVSEPQPAPTGGCGDDTFMMDEELATGGAEPPSATSHDVGGAAAASGEDGGSSGTPTHVAPSPAPPPSKPAPPRGERGITIGRRQPAP